MGRAAILCHQNVARAGQAGRLQAAGEAPAVAGVPYDGHLDLLAHIGAAGGDQSAPVK